jgi:hypothetical protein
MIDPPPGSSQKVCLAQRLVSDGRLRRPSTGTLVVAETLMVLVVVSQHCSVMKSLPLRESEDAWYPSCLPLWLSKGERKTLSEKVKKCKMVISAR